MQGFGQVLDADGFAFREISDGAGELEDAVMAAAAEGQAVVGAAQEAFGVGFESADAGYQAGGDFSVGEEPMGGEAVFLDLAGTGDAGLDIGRGFALGVVGHLGVLEAGDVDVDVDAVEQRA